MPQGARARAPDVPRTAPADPGPEGCAHIQRLHGEILQYTNELLPHANQIAQRDPDNYPTFFEWMTAMAFVHFKRSKVDLAILETGLGGRLDSTNVVQPQASVGAHRRRSVLASLRPPQDVARARAGACPGYRSRPGR